MAEQHKKADGTQTENGDIPVVTPMNIGKGLLWDPATKTYYVAIDKRMFDVDELGRLKLRVSALEDNQLKMRDDGIYQGGTARPDLRRLHVANHGNDSNPGTREAPLQTIQEALNRLEDIVAWYDILLHENHQFEWVWSVKNNTRVSFRAYGPTVDSTYPDATNNNAYYRGYTAKTYPRPTINVRVRERNNYIMRDNFSARDINMYGLRVNIYNRFEGSDDLTKSGHFAGFINANDEMLIHGCILNEVTASDPSLFGRVYRNDVVFRGPRLLWIDSICEKPPVYMLSSTFTTQLSPVVWAYPQLDGQGEKPNHDSLTKSSDPLKLVRAGFTTENILNVVFYEPTKTVLGITLNWDIFANP